MGGWMSRVAGIGLAIAFAGALAPSHALAEASTPRQAAGEAPVSTASDTAPFDARETEAIREIVRAYLLENPELIIEVIETLQSRRDEAGAERQRTALADHMEALHDPGPLPVLGNPEGDVTVVEFVDYRCSFCRAVTPTVMETVEADGNVRLIVKEWPILGPESLVAARAALASAEQGAYEAFHLKLMTEVQPVDEANILALADHLGLDVERLRSDMDADWVTQELRRSYGLADALGITGTPAFVIEDTVVPGAMDRERMEELIAQARANAR